jgi:hypothetical protein
MKQWSHFVHSWPDVERKPPFQKLQWALTQKHWRLHAERPEIRWGAHFLW